MKKPKSVEVYFRSLTDKQAFALRKLRDTIAATAP